MLALPDIHEDLCLTTMPMQIISIMTLLNDILNQRVRNRDNPTFIQADWMFQFFGWTYA